MNPRRKDRIRALLKGIETGDAAAATVVNPDKYIQHNPQTREGGEGLAALFKRLSKSNPRVGRWADGSERPRSDGIQPGICSVFC